MTHYSSDVLVDAHADVGEGPCWDDETGVLWFVDVTPGRLFRVDVATGTSTSQTLGGSTSAAMPMRGGGLVLATEDGVRLLDGEGRVSDVVVPVESDDPTVRMNDAATDPVGRLWAGAMAFDHAPGRSTLYRFEGGRALPVEHGCTIANGMGWSPDGQSFYFIDTPTQRIDRFRYDVTTGEARDRTPWVTIDRGSPDGLTVDAEGCVWVALWGGAAVQRFAPSGELIDVVELPVPQVTSVCFGGPDLTHLFVTSATYRLTPEELSQQPLAGATFVVQTGTKGVPTVPVDPACLGV